VIVVESDNEPAQNLDAVGLQELDLLQHVPLEVLALVALLEARLFRSFDADKHPIEPGLSHQGDQFRVIGQRHRHLRVERDAGLIFAPLNDGRQQSAFEIRSIAQ
jgi:hypothetical protein